MLNLLELPTNPLVPNSSLTPQGCTGPAFSSGCPKGRPVFRLLVENRLVLKSIHQIVRPQSLSLWIPARKLIRQLWEPGCCFVGEMEAAEKRRQIVVALSVAHSRGFAW